MNNIGNSKLDSYSTNMHNVQGGVRESFQGKPRIPKDNSKYIKKKSKQNSDNNLDQIKNKIT